jgi:NADH-quinone oxidoreductase subunit E
LQAAEAKKAEAKKAEAAKAEAPAAEEAEPETLKEARGGLADDLKLLKGVGPKLEQPLNELGFFPFDQIAAWTAAEVAWVDSRLKFKGRIERDGWIEQARQLADGEETEFAKRAKDEGTYEK